MSLELHDLRVKITPRTHCALEARARRSGRERTEIVREILDEWAGGNVHEATVLHRQLLAEGLPGIAEGGPGKIGEGRG
jgi:hypothetical protein